MRAKQKQTQPGFTIVELLIVIVIIGILAAITTVAYNGIQQRARDSKRLQDVASIQKVLAIYKASTGSYPYASATQTALGGWEASTDTAGTFMEYLSPYASQLPLDPTNDSTYAYKYFKYPAGYAGCDVTRGDLYVLVIQRLESKSGNGHGPGFSCTGRDWGANEGAWVTGAYTN